MFKLSEIHLSDGSQLLFNVEGYSLRQFKHGEVLHVRRPGKA
jgi:hypothetical protein